MSLTLWHSIAILNRYLHPLRNADSPSALALINLVELRKRLRAQLDHLRHSLIQQYSEQEAYWVLFPLTAHCDELIKQNILKVNTLEWPSLQQELYQVEDAGDLFYELLDNILKKPDTLPFVYEVYYFCLKDGFLGRYANNLDKINYYLEKLRPHIVLQPLPEVVESTAKPKKWAHIRILNRVYYVATAGLIIALYFLLKYLGSSWFPSSQL